MQSIVTLLIDYPILTLFLTIGLGYVVGQVNIFGFRFGTAGVLFVGLAIGALHPSIALPEAISTLGLIIFVYTIGIHSGPALADAFKRHGLRDNALVAGMLVFAAILTTVLCSAFGVSAPSGAGLFCGALTNTPALAAARETIQEISSSHGIPAAQIQKLAAEPVVTYGIAYPIGVIGLLLSYQLLGRFWRKESKPELEVPEIMVRDFVVKNPGIAGRAIGEALRPYKNLGFVISRIQHKGAIDIANSTTKLGTGDIVAVVGDEEALDRAEQLFGAASETEIEWDPSNLDYRRVFVSSKKVVGKTIRELDLQNKLHATITSLRRGDVDVVPNPGTRLEFGDYIRVLTSRERFADISKFFGDSIRGTAETDFGSVGIGLVLGVLVGMLPIPLPGGTIVRLGLAGGPLLVALALGKIERTGRINWVIPLSANLTLREIGLLLFLAAVGTRAGYSFVSTMATTGPMLLGVGAMITFGVALTTLIIGHKVLKIPFDALTGIVSGMHTQPAALAFATAQAKSETPNVAYAGVYPIAMIGKIMLAQILVSWPFGQ